MPVSIARTSKTNNHQPVASRYHLVSLARFLFVARLLFSPIKVILAFQSVYGCIPHLRDKAHMKILRDPSHRYNFILTTRPIPSSFRISLTSVHPTSSMTTTTLDDYVAGIKLEEEYGDDELRDIFLAVAKACTEISHQLAVLPLMSSSLSTSDEQNDSDIVVNVQGEVQKEMDVIAHDLFVNYLKPVVAELVSEEEENIIPGGCTSKKYAIAFDPLDGSSNLDVNVPTGTIFGIYIPAEENVGNEKSLFFSKNMTGRSSLIAAGYVLYSSSTEMVISVEAKQAVGFTLDPRCNRFVLSRENIKCSERGPYYSLNEAREPDWPAGLKKWIHDAKVGRTPSGGKYSSRYICSLVGDFHRTLLKGGWAGNPRPHLRLLYEAAPLAYIVEAAGGYGSDGEQNLLDVELEEIHDRVCVFLGSKKDVSDLEGYGDIQQEFRRYDA